jgi:hypothetical protein
MIDYAPPASLTQQRAVRFVSVPTSEVRCDHCARIAFEVVGNTIVVVTRHDQQYHKTVVSLDALGLQWKADA